MHIQEVWKIYMKVTAVDHIFTVNKYYDSTVCWFMWGMKEATMQKNTQPIDR